jgi:histidinol-phosphate/aromatic aminotransferase/cobyric acid decarboxylase-like protein
MRCLTLGNGSNDLLVMLAEAFLTPRHSAVCSQYGFAIYPLVTRATGAQPASKCRRSRPMRRHAATAMTSRRWRRAIAPDTRLRVHRQSEQSDRHLGRP